MDIDITGARILISRPEWGGFMLTETVVVTWVVMLILVLACRFMTAHLEVHPTPPPSDDEPPRDLPHRLWPLLLLLLLALLAALRLYLCAPAQVAGRQKNANDALLVWYRAAEDALLCMGIAPLPGEAPASFLWRAQGELHDAVKLTGLGKALCVAQYSGRALKRTQPERAQKVYAALFAQMTPRQKLRLFARRFIRGIRL